MNKATAPDTFGTTVTAPEVTSTIDEHTSEVTGQLPIGKPAAPIRMAQIPEVVRFALSSIRIHFSTS